MFRRGFLKTLKELQRLFKIKMESSEFIAINTEKTLVDTEVKSSIDKCVTTDTETPKTTPEDGNHKTETGTQDQDYKTIIEGQAEIRVQKNVFYNPVQEFNRDLSIAVLSIFVDEYKVYKMVNGKKSRHRAEKAETLEREESPEFVEPEVVILEALAASGLRSIRYAKEVEGITKIIANDLSEQAVKTIDYNVEYNGVKHIVETSHDDACNLMYKHKHHSKRFAAIDLDPYGCPSQFLDSAIQSIDDGGLLLVTATDMAVLAGVVPETCFSKYGAVSVKSKSCHEMALRILLFSIEQHANRYNRYILPLLSIAADFYVRVFVQVFTGAIHCKKTTSKLSYVYHCVGCETTTLQPLGGTKPNPNTKSKMEKYFLPTGPPVDKHCEHCNQRHHVGGPIWSAPLHKEFFVTKLLGHIHGNPDKFGTGKRLQGVVRVVQEELRDAPLYFAHDRLFGAARLRCMPMLTLRSAILNGGYRVSFSHACKLSVKTDAPARFIWDIIRHWETLHPIKPEKKEKNPVAKYLLSQPMTYQIDLTEHPSANPGSRQLGQLRFQTNPTPHWGPGSRAQVNTGDERQCKAIKNQNKNAHKRKNKEKRPRSPPSDGESHKRPNTEDNDSIAKSTDQCKIDVEVKNE